MRPVRHRSRAVHQATVCLVSAARHPQVRSPNTCTSHYIVAGMPLARGVHRTSKSWLTRSNAKGMNDLQAARTLIPRKQSCSRHAAVNDFICTETHEADGSKPKGIPKRLFFFLTCRDGASKTTKVFGPHSPGVARYLFFYYYSSYYIILYLFN